MHKNAQKAEKQENMRAKQKKKWHTIIYSFDGESIELQNDLGREAEECLVFQKAHSWISGKAITEMVATDLLCGECIK